MRGNNIIRENNTAIPSLFAISPMIRPGAVLMIPMKRMRWMIAVGLEFSAEGTKAIKRIVLRAEK